jgi:mono/diheme cytochrome c family protein
MRTVLILSLLLLGAAPVFAAPNPGSLPDPESGGVNTDRGRSLASLHCARCHDIAGDKSPRPTAPPFRTIRSRYSHDSLVSELQAIGQRGHFEMQPVYLSPSEIRDIVAYVDTAR